MKTQQHDDGPRAYSIAEVARRLGVSRDLVYVEINAGRLRSVRVSNRHVISAKALEEFLDD